MVNETMRPRFEAALPEDSRRVVCGEGRENSPALMLIGEAPGGEEEKLGRPFVGKAGKNLDGFLEAVGLERGEIWISNVVKVRPSRVGPTGRTANRPPDRAELEAFTPLLKEEILLVRPRLLVTLGNTALRAVLGRDASVGTLHGRAVSAEISAGGERLSLPLFALYHPASVIYNRSLSEVYAHDLELLRTFLTEQKL